MEETLQQAVLKQRDPLKPAYYSPGYTNTAVHLFAVLSQQLQMTNTTASYSTSEYGLKLQMHVKAPSLTYTICIQSFKIHGQA